MFEQFRKEIKANGNKKEKSHNVTELRIRMNKVKFFFFLEINHGTEYQNEKFSSSILFDLLSSVTSL